MLTGNKKKILFVIPDFCFGGVIKSLTNLLPLLQEENRYVISVYVLYEDGEEYFKQQLDRYLLPKSRGYYWLHDNRITRKVMGLYFKIKGHLDWNFLYRREALYLQKKYKFDSVIAFQEGMTTEFVSFFNVVKKLAWIHCDYISLCGRAFFEQQKTYYSTFSDIVCVSENAMQGIRTAYPEYDGHLWTIHNVMNDTEIRNMSMHAVSDYPRIDGTFQIISLGRSDKVKQFEKIPFVVRELLEKGVKNVRWAIIASGGICDREIAEAIEKAEVGDYVTLMTGRANPYPYIAHSDLLVSTSLTESYPTVINEAKILGVPVVANDYPSAKEIVDKDTGFICPIRGMADLIAELVTDREGKYTCLKNNLQSYKFPNREILAQIHTVINTRSSSESSRTAKR